MGNNIANAATAGYKAENVTSQSFEDVLAFKIRDNSEYYVDQPMGTMNLGVRLGEVYTDYGQGSLRQTDDNYNVAIEGKGFFEMRKGDEIRYTRDGSFKMDRDGYMIDADGNHVQGESGDIQVPLEASIYIDNYGGIFADGAYIDSIKLVDFEDYDYLEKIGDTSYKTVDGAVMFEGTGTILQGFALP